MKSFIHLILILIISVLLGACGNRDLSINEKYPMPWREPNSAESLEVGRTLVKNSIAGCGEYYVRPCSESTGSYLVSCSSDDKNWNYYIVWTGVQEVMAVYSDTTIQEPK